jgi:hypothetical protein
MGQAQSIADAIAQMAVEQTAATPAVRRGDWRTAVVAALGTDGTVSTTDGIVARRAAVYEAPLVGDLIRLAQSGAGSWVADGRLTPTGGDGWLTPALTSPWANFGSGYQAARYRLYACGDVAIEGVVGTGATSVTGTSAVFTLPAGCWPTATQMVGQVMNGNVIRQLTINSLGQVRFVNLPAGTVTFVTLNCRFSTL